MERWFKYLVDKYNIEGARSKFEEIMTVTLKKINNGNAFNVRTYRGDCGVDVYIGDLNESPDIYQCKFFLDGIDNPQKRQIKESIDKALETHSINKWVLCVPCNLNHKEHEWWCKFKKEYENKGIKKIELYDEIQLISMMKNYELYDEFFDTVRIDKTFAEKLCNKVIDANKEEISKQTNEVKNCKLEECYNESTSTYSYRSQQFDFLGFLPLFPERMVGSCSIEFKRIELSNIIITFNHKEIFSLFEAIQTKGNNYFVSQERIFDNKIRFFVENIMLLLTNEEVTELILTINTYYVYYIRDLKRITSHLEIDKFYKSRDRSFGYRLFKVKIELWEVMKEYANEHDCLNGDTEWHMFEPNYSAINVMHSLIPNNQRYNHGMHAYFNVENTDNIRDEYVWLILNLYMSKDDETKLEKYNERNIWGALTSYNWCINEFIPQVLKKYKLYDIDQYVDDYGIKSKLNKSKESIISDLQTFYLSNNIWIEETEMDNIKQALIYCLSKKELPIDEYDYILGKLRMKENIIIRENSAEEVVKKIINLLKKGEYIKYGSLSSQADDFFRCILCFSGNSWRKRLSDEEFYTLAKILNGFIIKMEDIEFIRKYKEFSDHN